MSKEFKQELVCELKALNPAFMPNEVISSLLKKEESRAMTAEEFADTVLDVFDESSMARMFYSMREVGV